MIDKLIFSKIAGFAQRFYHSCGFFEELAVEADDNCFFKLFALSGSDYSMHSSNILLFLLHIDLERTPGQD